MKKKIEKSESVDVTIEVDDAAKAVAEVGEVEVGLAYMKPLTDMERVQTALLDRLRGCPVSIANDFVENLDYEFEPQEGSMPRLKPFTARIRVMVQKGDRSEKRLIDADMQVIRRLQGEPIELDDVLLTCGATRTSSHSAVGVRYSNLYVAIRPRPKRET